jgi:hypothetical protein
LLPTETKPMPVAHLNSIERFFLLKLTIFYILKCGKMKESDSENSIIFHDYISNLIKIYVTFNNLITFYSLYTYKFVRVRK